MNLGKRLKEARERAGLSQEALARRADVSTVGLAQIEQGRTKEPHYLTLHRLSQVLGVDPHWLYTGEAPKSEAAVNHLRGMEDSYMDRLAARIDADKEAAGPQSPPVAIIKHSVDKRPVVQWLVPEEERGAYRADLTDKYGTYDEEEGETTELVTTVEVLRAP